MGITKKKLAAMTPAAREQYLEEAADRAERKTHRTQWITGATWQQKQDSLQIALGQVGGRKKYSWLQQEPKTVAETLGQRRAFELGITTGKLAEELKIGEHDKSQENGGPQNLTLTYEELREAGFNVSREDLEQMMRDSGMPEDEIRASTDADKPVPVQPRPRVSEKRSSRDENDNAGTGTPAKRQKKKGTSAPKPAAEETAETTQTTGLASSPDPPTSQPSSSSPEARGSSATNAIELLDDDDNDTTPAAPAYFIIDDD